MVFHLEGVDEAQKIRDSNENVRTCTNFPFAIDLFTSSDFLSLRIDLEEHFKGELKSETTQTLGCETQKVFKKIFDLMDCAAAAANQNFAP